ncbi:hypothetical protein [Pseudoclavibacter helvolus]|uniref:hypothetical protein n=1 Tax=Pseudoclavibacter helvolus TaxID=255205 RepID=UPI003C729485
MRAEHIDPVVPDEVNESDLPKGARNELKTLEATNQEFVARHLVMASVLIDSDPELAHQHAVSAARRGGRIAMVRETLAITAYTIGDYALALRELRTYRRISGKEDQLALMIDSERGLGRPDRALELGRAADRTGLGPAELVQVAIAMSGARLDQGSPDLALAELEIPQLDPKRAYSYSPALFSAYATVLEELGRDADAERWAALATRAQDALDAVKHDEHETIEVVTEGEFPPLEPDEDEDEEEATASPEVRVDATEATGSEDAEVQYSRDDDDLEAEVDELLAEAEAAEDVEADAEQIVTEAEAEADAEADDEVESVQEEADEIVAAAQEAEALEDDAEAATEAEAETDPVAIDVELDVVPAALEAEEGTAEEPAAAATQDTGSADADADADDSETEEEDKRKGDEPEPLFDL